MIEIYEDISTLIENLRNGYLTGAEVHESLTKLKEKAFASGAIIEIPSLEEINSSQNNYNSSQADSYLSS